MKILQLGKFYPIKGGVEKVMYDLLNGFASRNIACDMLCANADTTERKFKTVEISSKNKILICPTFKKLFATMISPSLISELRKRCKEYDIIHVHHPDPMVALALFFSDYKGHVVLHWHSDILKQSKLLKLYRPLQNWLIHRASIIIGTTPVYITQSRDLSSVQNKCTYLPIGIDAIIGDETNVNKIKELYNGKKIIFSLGRLVEYKGFEYLIDAAKYLSDEYLILIGGSGPLKNKLQNQIDKNNLNDKVKLLGRISDEKLPSYYQAADVYCLSSIMKTEAFAIVQIEAMSCCKPVIATNIPGSGVSWVNEDCVSGKNVEIKNGRAIAKAIETILSDAKLYKTLSDGAKNRYNTLFKKETMIDKCLEIYRRLYC